MLDISNMFQNHTLPDHIVHIFPIPVEIFRDLSTPDLWTWMATLNLDDNNGDIKVHTHQVVLQMGFTWSFVLTPDSLTYIIREF